MIVATVGSRHARNFCPGVSSSGSQSGKKHVVPSALASYSLATRAMAAKSWQHNDGGSRRSGDIPQREGYDTVSKGQLTSHSGNGVGVECKNCDRHIGRHERYRAFGERGSFADRSPAPDSPS